MKTTIKLKWFRYFLTIGVIFWLSKTILFLFAYGWHMKATQMPEIACDLIAQMLYIIGWIFFILAGYDIMLEFAPILDKINDVKKSLKRIKDIDEQLEAIRNTCSHEYEKVDDGNDFCPKCGNIVENPQPCQE